MTQERLMEGAGCDLGAAGLLLRLENEIRSMAAHDESNRLPDGRGTYFDEPLLGVAAGDDPLFDLIKEQVGPQSMTPVEALNRKLGEAGLPPAKAGEVSVVSWVLPVSEGVRAANREAVAGPAGLWALMRNHGEGFNNRLRRHLEGWLEGQGIPALAPAISPWFAALADPERRGYTSTWSERHVAYAAGLGTFSLNDALITERGIAHRLGSVVLLGRLEPTPRPYRGLYDHCLMDIGCRACIKRCPVDALSPAGHDKYRCDEMCYHSAYSLDLQKRHAIQHVGCGLCQTKVPCEYRIPPRKSKAT